MNPGQVGGKVLLLLGRIIVILRLRLMMGRQVGRRAGSRARVLLVTITGARLELSTGSAVEAAAGAAQAQVLPLPGPSLAPQPSLRVHWEESFVSLGETGVQAHFAGNFYLMRDTQILA